MQRKIFSYFTIILLLNQDFSFACSNIGRNTGEAAARHLSDSIKTSTKNLENALTASTTSLTNSINNAVNRLENVAKTAANELGFSIRQASKDLVKISEKVTGTIDKGVKEMSNVLKEAINTTKAITDRLLQSADKAVISIGNQVKNAVDTIREISKDLTKSIDNGVNELGKTLRYVADKIVEAAKQINFKIDTNHLVGVANATGDALVRSVQELSTNWKVALNTADLRDVGKGAAEELSEALQNLRGHFELHVGVDDNLRRSILYISVAAGIAFSVLFVAIVVALKSCRSCTVKLFMLVVDQCKSRKSDDSDNAEAPEVESNPQDSKFKTNLNNWNELRPLKKNAKKKITSEYESDLSEDEGKNTKKFNKKLTMSLADYKDYPTIRNKWVRKAKNDTKKNTRKK